MSVLAPSPQCRALLLQMHAVQQQGELPGGDAAHGHLHPREVSPPQQQQERLRRSDVASERLFFFAEMHRGRWRQTPILTCWRCTHAVTPTNASAVTAEPTLLRPGTDRLLGGGRAGAHRKRRLIGSCLFLLLKLVRGDSLPPVWLQGDAQEVLEAENRNQSLGLHRLHRSHRRQRSGPRPRPHLHLCSVELTFALWS